MNSTSTTGVGAERAEPQTASASASACTVSALADRLAVPTDLLREGGFTDSKRRKRSVVRVSYQGADGRERGARLLHAIDGTRRTWDEEPSPAVYSLRPRGVESGTDPVVLVGDELDAVVLANYGMSAVALTGPYTEETEAFLASCGITTVAADADGGEPREPAWMCSGSFPEDPVLVPLGRPGSLATLHAEDPGRFLEHWEHARRRGRFLSDVRSAATDRRRAELREATGGLSQSPDVLRAVADALLASGFAGDTSAALTLYLACTSRVLQRPVSVAVKATSSAGKSYLVERVLELLPATAYHELSGMSERALIYSREPLKHRMLVIAEATGLIGEYATYMVRSLLSEGRIRYEVTIFDSEAGPDTVVIEKEGPTGLIVTTTEISLHPENETRMLSLSVSDTAEQTKAILHALIEEDESEIELAPFHALQDYLALGPKRVTLPFRHELADAIPPVAVRLRRDFRAVLALIRAHALLHQDTRERDGEGRVVATLNDYAAVYRLVAPLVAEGAGQTVAGTVRETVEAVAALYPSTNEKGVTYKMLEKELDLDNGSVSRRVRGAEARGYVKSIDDKRGVAKRVAPGEPLPGDAEILPHPDHLAKLCGSASSAPGRPPEAADASAAESEVEQATVRGYESWTWTETL